MIRKSALMIKVSRWAPPNLAHLSPEELEQAWKDWASIETAKRLATFSVVLRPTLTMIYLDLFVYRSYTTVVTVFSSLSPLRFILPSLTLHFHVKQHCGRPRTPANGSRRSTMSTPRIGQIPGTGLRAYPCRRSLRFSDHLLRIPTHHSS